MEKDLWLPLIKAYFEPEEIDPMVQKIVASGPPEEMGEDTSFRNEFMVRDSEEGVPDFLWESRRNS